LHRLENQRGIGRRILRPEGSNLPEIPVSATTVVKSLSASSWFMGLNYE